MRIVHRSLGPLGLRFAAAFVGVSLFAVAVFSVAVLIADRSNVDHLAATERSRTTGAVVALLETAYRSAGGWTSADLGAVRTIARHAGVGVSVRRPPPAGVTVLARPPTGSGGSDRSVTQVISIDGRAVGAVTVDFPAGGVGPGDSHLRSSLSAAVAWSAALAALAALIIGVMTARTVVRPVRRLAAAVRSLKLGERAPRVGPSAGPGELGELGRAFDAMAESLEQEDRLRRALVADIAHELRTPVAIMQAETEALSDGVTEPSREALGSLHEEAVRLGRLVQDLQTMASAQAAGLELDRRPLDLGRVAADAANSLAPQFRRREIELELDLPPTEVLGDVHRLHQVVVNLLTNAAKFTPVGGRVRLSTRRTGEVAVLELTDSGPGIAESEREAIWRRFYRGRAGRDGDGSGIGLAVVKELIDAHDGEVAVDRPPEGGARFTIRLPGVDAAAGPDRATGPRPERTSP